MIHTIDCHSAAQGVVLRAMFEARKRVFVDLLKWDVPLLGGTWELDQFDGQDATYIVVADDEGRHLGSARLLRTSAPHILDTIFPHLCDVAIPHGPDVFEITRFCLDRDLRASERRQVRNRLVTALAQHAIACGIRSYTAIAELSWFQQILAFGWRCIPLGLPKTSEGSTLAAVQIEIDEDTPSLLAEAGIWTPTWLTPQVTSKAA